jgi:DinB superfamily
MAAKAKARKAKKAAVKSSKPSGAGGARSATDAALRKQLVEFLSGEGAHVSLEKAMAGIPENLRGARPQGAEHSAWEIIEHIRIAEWDILEFSRNAKHQSPDWPSGYWPKSAAPPDGSAWNKSIAEIERDLKGMTDLVASPKTDLFAKIPWGSGQTYLREALILADHNSYHTGELVLLRRMLGAWGA